MNIRDRQTNTLVIDGRRSEAERTLSQQSEALASDRAITVDEAVTSEIPASKPEGLGQQQIIGNIKQDLSNAVNAVRAIEALKQQQLDNITKAEGLALGDERTDLLNEAATAQQEINEIADRAVTTTGEQLLDTPRTYTYTDTRTERTQVVAIGGGGFINNDDTSSSTVAAQGVRSLSSFASGLEIALSKADSFDEPVGESAPLVSKQNTPEPPLDIEAAQALARKIAAKVSSPYQSESRANKLIEAAAGDLDPSTVIRLLI